MLMPVLGGSSKKRRQAIIRMAKHDLEMGFLLAEFNFEWTLRRCILALSKCPTVVIRERLSGCHGWDAYRDAWTDCVKRFSPAMKSIGGLLEDVSNADVPIVNIQQLKEALDGRHILAHGIKGGVSDRFAIVGSYLFLNAADRLQWYAQLHGKSVFGNRIYRAPKCVDYGKCLDCPYVLGENVDGGNRTIITTEVCSEKMVKKCPFVGERNSVSRRCAMKDAHNGAGAIYDAFAPEKVLCAINKLGLTKAKTVAKLRNRLLQELEAISKASN